MECKRSMDIFNNINQAQEYLMMIHQAVCRRKLDGTVWNIQDYINWIKENIK